MINKSATPKSIHRQQIRLIVVITFIVLLFIGLGLWLTDSPVPKNGTTTAHAATTLTAVNREPVDAATLWLQRAENSLQEQQKALQALTEKMQHLEEQQTLQLAQANAQAEQFEPLQQRLSQFEEQMKQLQTKPMLASTDMSSEPSSLPILPASRLKDNNTQSPLSPEALAIPVNRAPAINAVLHTKGLSRANQAHLHQHTRAKTPSFSDNPVSSRHNPQLLTEAESEPKFESEMVSASPDDKTPATYIPAGSFIRAVLLSGLDAGAGVTSQAQPRPILLRLTGKATLPNRQQSDLQDCLVTGAGYGDISSERAYIRLERMSCQHQGHVTDFPVYGYVIGSDGKAGIRGQPVWREKTLLQRSFFSGLLAGLGQGVSNRSSTATAGSVPGLDIAKQGLATGTSTSLGKLADYHIQRAEQYQPIIQISAGAHVDIVFHTGFYLDGHIENAANTPLIPLAEPIASLPDVPESPDDANDTQ